MSAQQNLARVLFEAHMSKGGWDLLSAESREPWLQRAAAAGDAGYTRPRPIASVDALNSMWVGSVVFTFDWLAWQATSSHDGVVWWSNTTDGFAHSIPSSDLMLRNKDQALNAIFDPGPSGGGLI